MNPHLDLVRRVSGRIVDARLLALLFALLAAAFSARPLLAGSSSGNCATGGYPNVCQSAGDHSTCQAYCNLFEPFSHGWCYTEPQTSPPNYCCSCLP